MSPARVRAIIDNVLDGIVQPFNRAAKSTFDHSAGAVVGHSVNMLTAEDITERKRADDALRESEERHRELFEQSPIGIWEEDYSAVKPMIDGLAQLFKDLGYAK